MENTILFRHATCLPYLMAMLVKDGTGRQETLYDVVNKHSSTFFYNVVTKPYGRQVFPAALSDHSVQQTGVEQMQTLARDASV